MTGLVSPLISGHVVWLGLLTLAVMKVTPAWCQSGRRIEQLQNRRRGVAFPS